MIKSSREICTFRGNNECTLCVFPLEQRLQGQTRLSFTCQPAFANDRTLIRSHLQIQGMGNLNMMKVGTCHQMSSQVDNHHPNLRQSKGVRKHSEAEHSQIFTPRMRRFHPTPRRRSYASGHGQCRKGRKEAEQDDLYTHGSSESTAEQRFKAARCVCPSCAHHGRAKHHRQIEPDCRRHCLRFCTFSFVESISLRLHK